VNKYVIGLLLLTTLAVGRVAATYSTFTATSEEPAPALARIAISEPRLLVLPFLVFTCIVTFLWSRRWFGDAAAVWAVLLLVSTPPILGHAGLATLDLAFAATTLGVLYEFMRWLEERSWRRSIWLGIAIAAVVVLLSMGVTYGTPEPYLLGGLRNNGWWYFFPVVLAVKTPIGLLLLSVLGIYAVLARRRSVPWQHVLTAVFAIVILLVCMALRSDLGVRQILVIYPLLAILGGAVIPQATQIAAASTERMRMLAVLPAVLAVWVAAASLRAHPDYLAYFNEFVGAHPEKILVESDLDWGQDLHRLSQRLQVLGVNQISIAYFGSAPLDQAGLPPYQILPPDHAVPGYVAISVQRSTVEFKRNGSYAWLKRYRPLERVGKSIDLFWIQE
jgi:4-amino-4-deoxy-L-arabinose transferase-like glycosyltransferase